MLERARRLIAEGRPLAADALAIGGFGLIAYGISLLSVPASLIFGGVVLVIVALFLAVR